MSGNSTTVQAATVINPVQSNASEEMLRQSLGSVTRDDIVRVRIEDIKRALLVRQSTAKTALEALQKQAAIWDARLTEIGQEIVKTVDLTPYQEVIDAVIKPFGIKDKQVLVTAALVGNDQKKGIYTIQINSPIGEGYNTRYSKQLTVKYTPEAKKLVGQLGMTATAATTHQEELNLVRKELADLPSKTEQIKADLSRMALEQAGGLGNQVLARLDSNTPKLITGA